MQWRSLKCATDINIDMKIILIVLDSVGAGALPDAEKYGDKGTNTLKHIFESMGKDFVLPNLGKLGLYDIVSSPFVCTPENIVGNYGKMATMSPAKDTTAGHWELSGVILNKPFPTYSKGFPKGLIEEFEKQIGTKVLGNCVASGTEIIKQLGDEHYKTGYPIVYTSADSVFQIAVAEDLKTGRVEDWKIRGCYTEQGEGFHCSSLEWLYHICSIARKMLTGEHAVGRVIARPFVKKSDGTFERTSNRKDYSLDPLGETVLDKIVSSGGKVISIGKIKDIFNNRGISVSYHTANNVDGIQKTIDCISDKTDSDKKQLIFTNLVDFDMLWGHRRNVEAYAKGLKYFDEKLPEIISTMSDNDLLMVTADHGCDPTYKVHTDHTREYVPLMVYGKKIKQNINLGTRNTLSDVAQTIADIFELTPMKNGKSFRNLIRN